MVTEHARRLSDTPAEGVDMLGRLPKVELHLHLVGTIRPATVCAQARRYAPDSPFCHDGWQAGFWSFGDLTTALAALRQVREIALRSADDYYLVARECFEDLAAQQVLYAEVSVGHPEASPRPLPLRVVARHPRRDRAGAARGGSVHAATRGADPGAQSRAR